MGQEPKHLLVVKLRTLGDILTTFPLLRALKERFPRARLSVAADDTYADLFSANPRVDAFWPHPAQSLKVQGLFSNGRYLGRLVRRIRQEKVDLYIDLYGSLRTASWGFLAGVPRRLGFNLRGRKHFYSEALAPPHRHVVDLNLEFARRLGWQGHNRALEFFFTPEDQSQADQHLTRQGWHGEPFAVVSPGGGWPLKLWGAEKFGQVAERLQQVSGGRIVISGTPAEQPLIERCASRLSSPALAAVGLPLRVLAALISRSRLFIGNDSGPKYFAEAFGVRTLICYGPTDYLNNNPTDARHRVACHEVSCRPCHSETCRQGSRVCLDDLAVDEVTASALDLWAAAMQDGSAGHLPASSG